MREIEVVSFDCYGTLIDWESGMREAFAGLAKKRQVSLDLDRMVQRYIKIELEVEKELYRKYREVLSMSLGRLLRQERISPTPEEERLLVDTLPRWPPFPETKEVLETLRGKGYSLVILSNVDDDLIQHSVKSLGVRFDGIITAEQTKSYKPSHSHWIRMLEAFGVNRDRVLHVAASYVHDIRPAKELGFRVAWINRGGEEPEMRMIPDYVFRDLRPLTEIL